MLLVVPATSVSWSPSSLAIFMLYLQQANNRLVSVYFRHLSANRKIDDASEILVESFVISSFWPMTRSFVELVIISRMPLSCKLDVKQQQTKTRVDL